MMFLTVFAAVFCAIILSQLVERYTKARTINRAYCHKEALRYEKMGQIARLRGRDVKLDAQQVAQWRKWADSLIPIHPTQSEQELEIEQSQDDAIRQLVKDLDYWQEQQFAEEKDSPITS
jgi:hypothetical protein